MAKELADDSVVVEIVTWILYLTWLSALVSVALYFQLEPLQSLREWFEVPWQGTLAALAAGNTLLVGASKLAERARARSNRDTKD
jgi:hypothetical protein